MVDKAGHLATPQAIHRFLQMACENSPPSFAEDRTMRSARGARVFGDHCMQRISAHFHLAVTYQPAARYCPLQLTETAIFLSLAFILAGLCSRSVRQRRYA